MPTQEKRIIRNNWWTRERAVIGKIGMEGERVRKRMRERVIERHPPLCSSNSISDAGATALSCGLAGCTALQSLDLRCPAPTPRERRRAAFG